MRTDKDREIKIMGIVNLTDDSYFADSRCCDAASAVKKIGEMIDAGADIIDLGACSTRPGSIPVGEEEEWRRLSSALPIIKAT
jgi:dihydropteroate synthase